MESIYLINVLVSALFAKTFGGGDYDYAYYAIQTNDGGYAITGETYGFGAGLYDFIFLKLNPDGGIAFAKTFGGPNHEYARSLIQTPDGGYAVAGATLSFGAGDHDWIIFRLNSAGGLIWAKTYGGPNWDYARSIIHESNGGYVVVGWTESFGAGSYDLLIIKLDSDGSVSWAKTYGGASNDIGWCMIKTSDGGYAVAGYTSSFGAGGYDCLVVKLDYEGNVIWAKTFGGTAYDYAYSIIQIPGGDYVVAGRTQSFGAGNYDFLVMRLDPDGNLRWARTIGGSQLDYAYSIILDSEGDYVVTGHTASFGAGNYDLLVVKMEDNGTIGWARTIGGPNQDGAYSLIQGSDGCYVLAGYTNSFGSGNYDLFIMKINPDGTYPSCDLRSCSPLVGNINPLTSSQSFGAECNLSPSTPNLTITDPNLNRVDVCQPLYEQTEEGVSGAGLPITYFPVSGGLLFISEAETDIKLYTPEGRLVYSGSLQKGENRISLETGVYIWRVGAGPYKGKAIVR